MGGCIVQIELISATMHNNYIISIDHSQYVIKVDLMKEYLQISLTPHAEYTVMPVKMKNAPGIF